MRRRGIFVLVGVFFGSDFSCWDCSGGFIARMCSWERAAVVLRDKPRFVTVEHFRRAVRMLRRMKKAVVGPEEKWKKYQIPTEFA